MVLFFWKCKYVGVIKSNVIALYVTNCLLTTSSFKRKRQLTWKEKNNTFIISWKQYNLWLWMFSFVIRNRDEIHIRSLKYDWTFERYEFYSMHIEINLYKVRRQWICTKQWQLVMMNEMNWYINPRGRATWPLGGKHGSQSSYPNTDSGKIPHYLNFYSKSTWFSVIHFAAII